MPTYVALLRGVNLGPHKRMRMDALRESFEGLGFEQVTTYIQSGNVVFKTRKSSPIALSNQIEQKIVADFGFSAPVVTRTVEEMAKTTANNPFLKEPGIDITRLHVMFLSDAPLPVALKKLAEVTEEPDRSRCVGKEIYLHLPNGAGKSTLMMRPLDRILSVGTTTRNWNTVNALHQMCQDCR